MIAREKKTAKFHHDKVTIFEISGYIAKMSLANLCSKQSLLRFFGNNYQMANFTVIVQPKRKKKKILDDDLKYECFTNKNSKKDLKIDMD